MTLSFVRWRMSGSKPPSSRHVRITISSQPAAGVAGRPGLAGELGQRHRAPPPPRGRVVRGQHEADRDRGAGPRARLPSGRESGWCCHSSASTRSTSPSTSAGSDSSGSASTSSQRSAGASRASACMAGTASWSAVDWKVAIRARPATLPAAAASSASASAARSSSASGVADEHERGVGQPHAAPGRLEQRHARLALEHGELLGDGRGRELERVRDRGDRAARVQLVEEAKPAQVEHSQAMLLGLRHQSESFLRDWRGTMRSCHRTGAIACLASAAAFGAMGVFGKLAYDEGATVGTLLATRFVLAAALFWVLLACAGGAPPAARPVRPRRRHRARARRDRLRRPGGRLLRRARAPRRLAARAARVHVPGDGHRQRDRARARAGEPAHDRRARARIGRPRAGAGRRRRGRARPARHGARPRRGGRLQRLHPDLGGRRRARRARSRSARSSARAPPRRSRSPASRAATSTRAA